ncbi:MAG: hypothetical protein QOG57_7140, partial [Pseudonocardiales bacterium]|nr:hypothetical protein [Pseudonocardiales bacterium]
RARLREAAAGWRRLRPPRLGDSHLANLVDLGRPPVVGLVEPDRELARVCAELADLGDLDDFDNQGDLGDHGGEVS